MNPYPLRHHDLQINAHAMITAIAIHPSTTTFEKNPVYFIILRILRLINDKGNGILLADNDQMNELVSTSWRRI